jgi:hypothetical protein
LGRDLTTKETTMSNTSYAPSFAAAKLYRKTSAKGSIYYVGRLGGAKVTLLRSNEVSENGDEVWSLMLSEAAPYQPKGDAKPKSRAYARGTDTQRPLATADRPAGRDDTHQPSAGLDDPMPF